MKVFINSFVFLVLVMLPHISQAKANFMDMTCEETKVTNYQDKIDYKALALEQIEIFKSQHPGADISKFEESVKNYKPSAKPSDHVHPLTDLVMAACEKPASSDETVGEGIQRIFKTVLVDKIEPVRAE